MNTNFDLVMHNKYSCSLKAVHFDCVVHKPGAHQHCDIFRQTGVEMIDWMFNKKISADLSKLHST